MTRAERRRAEREAKKVNTKFEAAYAEIENELIVRGFIVDKKVKTEMKKCWDENRFFNGIGEDGEMQFIKKMPPHPSFDVVFDVTSVYPDGHCMYGLSFGNYVD